MINTPLEAYDQLKHGDIVRDADGDLLKVHVTGIMAPVMELVPFADEYAAAIDYNGVMRNDPVVVNFPVVKVTMVDEESKSG